MSDGRHLYSSHGWLVSLMSDDVRRCCCGSKIVTGTPGSSSGAVSEEGWGCGCGWIVFSLY